MSEKETLIPKSGSIQGLKLDTPAPDPEMQRFADQYAISWMGEIRTTFLLLLSLGALCLLIFSVTFFFTPDSSKLDPRYKRIFLESINANSCKGNLKNITMKPHLAGTLESNELADYFVTKFREYLPGAKIEKVQYDVLLSYPTPESAVQLFDKNDQVVHTAQLFEDKVNGDEYTEIDPKLVPAHLAYSPNGEVKAKLIYGNFCTREDFDYLVSLNLNLQGTIVLCRYGRIFRGIKVQNAEKLGAKGVIVYSDPAQDGFVRGPVYPAGPNRPESGIQRGTLMYPTYPGDPTTPEYPSLPGTLNRLKREDVINLPQKTIVLPLSWRDAKKLLAQLEGPTAPAKWQGGIPEIVYKIGSLTGAYSTKIKVHNIEKITPIYNVIATINGKEEPDRSVIIGNHRDAWTFGGLDPHSGSIAMLEAAKGIGMMLSARWRPRRNIVFASWDAEEYGLIGSVEWVEQYAEKLKQQVVAYLNVDTSQGVDFDVEASPALAQVIRDEVGSIVSPAQTNTTLDKTWSNTTSYVGDGSDYAPFFHHLGIPVIAMDFHGKGSYGAYHSIYDNYNYVTRVMDPEMRVCQSLAGILGLVAIRLASDPVLPFVAKEQTNTLRKYISDLPNLSDYTKFRASLNPEDLVTFNTMIAQINTTINQFDLVATSFDKNMTLIKQNRDFKTNLRAYNDKAMNFERGFTRKEGIRGRPWYKHVICSPGVELGYDYEVFPGLMESMREMKLKESLGAIEQIVLAIKQATSILA